MMNKQKEVNSKSAFISIIVPIYKAEAYLPQCIESILAQSFHDFELLLVDDGSPDASGGLCDRYAELDARIRVIHKENGGVSSARNAGIDQALGSYIIFIDSDDYVGPDYLQELVAAAGDDGALVVSDYQPFNATGAEHREFLPETMVDICAATAEDFRQLIFGFRLFPPYCKLYQKKIIIENKIRFDTQMRTAEDFDFNMRYLQKMERIHCIPSVQYFYRVGYKAYVPSNAGVLGYSEIKSVHTMANGITALARRIGVYVELEEEICLWAAKKHYFNRLPMLFAENPQIGFWERYGLYKKLINDENYRYLHRRGICLAEKSTTKWIGKWCDCFLSWWIFYRLQHLRKKFRMR